MERNTTIKFETSPLFMTESFSFTIHFKMLRNWKNCYENNTNKKKKKRDLGLKTNNHGG